MTDSTAPSGATVPRRSRLLRIAEYAGAFLLALLAAEIGARLFLRLPPHHKEGEGGKLGMKVPESEAPGLLRALRPSAEAIAFNLTLDGEEVEVHYRINEHGFRDRVYPKERQEGVYRIAIVGDSVTFGNGISLEQTPAKILERLFEEHLPGGRVEVINCGVTAHNTTQQVAHLKYRVLDFQPDMVLICSTLTDAKPHRPQDRLLGRRGSFWELRWIERLGLTRARGDPEVMSDPARRRMSTLRKYSALADFLANRTHAWLRGRVVEADLSADWAEGSPGRQSVKRALTAARVLANRHDFDLRVALYPYLTELDDYPFRAEHAVLAGICAALKIPFYDLLPPLEGRNALDLHAHVYDPHPNELANILTTEYLLEFLLPAVEAGLQH